MLFHITQTHDGPNCPVDAGGSSELYNQNADGAKLQAMYGAFPEHSIYYLVEAESMDAVNEFLLPGFKRCTSKITPVSEEAIV